MVGHAVKHVTVEELLEVGRRVMMGRPGDTSGLQLEVFDVPLSSLAIIRGVGQHHAALAIQLLLQRGVHLDRRVQQNHRICLVARAGSLRGVPLLGARPVADVTHLVVPFVVQTLSALMLQRWDIFVDKREIVALGENTHRAAAEHHC